MVPVQAVLFLAFGTGVVFALSAARQLQHWQAYADAAPPGLLRRRSGTRAATPYLCLTVLFAGVLLGPSGLFLLWYNPSWATMHTAAEPWAGLAALYAGGTVTAAALGFLLAQWLCLLGAGYWAFLLAVAAHFLAFGTLVHGWDGRGYERLLSTNSRTLRTWSQDGIADHVLDFATSGTFLALLVFGAAVLGTLALAEIGWLMEGWSVPGADADRRAPRLIAVAVAAAGVYGLPLLGAVTASALVRLTGWPAGLVLFGVLAWLVLLPRRTPVRLLYGLVGIPNAGWRATAEAAVRQR